MRIADVFLSDTGHIFNMKYWCCICWRYWFSHNFVNEWPINFFFISLCIKHPNLFGGSEKLDVSWDKGLYDSNILIAYRRPREECFAHQSFVVQVGFARFLFMFLFIILFYGMRDSARQWREINFCFNGFFCGN